MTDGTNTDDSTNSLLDNVRASGENAGTSIGAMLMAPPLLIYAILAGITHGILGKLPKRTAVYRKMIRTGYKAMYKKTDAHVVVNTIYGDGQMVPRIAEEDTDTGNLTTANGEEWTVENGINEVRVGPTPVVTGVADQHETVDHVGARVAEAVDMGPSSWQQVVETNAGIQPVASQATATNGAMADGGAAAPRNSDIFHDIWVDASNPEPDNDGMIVSMKKMYELHWDQAGSEEMENQEKRGILAAKDPKSDTKQALIMVALALGGVCLGLFGPSLAQSIAGGGGGGPAIPITITATLGALI